ncbi:MAG: dehydrogenase E1 component subunit alpha/beta [Rubripirellula sp.]
MTISNSTEIPPTQEWAAESFRVLEGLYRQALLIRLVESKFLDLFSQGKLNGTVHTCVGQELIGPAVCKWLSDDDLVISNHRGHGHFIARTGNALGLIRELMGRATGVCGGVGGSQHLFADGFLSNGIQGGMTPIAAGVALAAKHRGEEAVAVAFVGDGTLGEGTLYEAVNFAGGFELPMVLVIERNGYAQSTATKTTMPGDLQSRFEGFGWVYHSTEIWDPSHLVDTAEAAIKSARKSKQPQVIDIGCYRLNSHSKGDDNRDPAEVEHYQAIDPLNRLLAAALPEVDKHITELTQQIESWIKQAEAEPKLERLARRPGIEQSRYQGLIESNEKDRINAIINRSLADWMRSDDRMILLGEDICDRTEGATEDYGGAFKVTRGLSTEFPDRVLNSPISEAALIGVGTGLALRGFRPVVEIMFGDFLTLCLDQLLQHAAKFRAMFNDQVSVPLIVRTPMGGKRGYGPTHSQSIEKFFVGIPGLKVIALCDRISPAKVYEQLADERDPTLVIENKVLYTRPLRPPASSPFTPHATNSPYPTVRLTMDDRRPDVTVFCYGEMLQWAEQAAVNAFIDREIVTDIVCPIQIHPLDISAIAESARQSGRVLTIEEGPSTAAVGAEVIAALGASGCQLKSVRRLGNDGIIPSSVDAELQAIPSVERITQTIKEMV